MCSLTPCLEWCTPLPSPDGSRKSPVFALQGNEWYFNFLYTKLLSGWFVAVYLKLHNKHTEIKETSVKFQVGFKNENNLSLETGEFKVSEHRLVWNQNGNYLQSMLPSDYLDGNWIKFKFFFNDEDEAHLKIKKETEEKSVQTASYIDTGFLVDNISPNFSKMLNEGPCYDLEFICGEQTMKAHKSILCCRSDVFASMLQSNMVEGKTGRVTIKDMDATLFREFLTYLYTGILPTLTVDIGFQFYEAGDKYNVSSLKKLCADFLTDNLLPENAYDILIFADRHNDLDFKKNVVDYMIEEQMPYAGEEWNDFCKDNLVLAVEVLNLFCQHLRVK